MMKHPVFNSQMSAMLASGAGALVLCGCSVLPTFGLKKKDADVDALQKTAPPAWSVSRVIKGGAATGWLDDFGSATLRRLVDRAIAENHDLRVAAARVDQSKALARIAGADLLPQLGTDFQGSRAQRSSGQRFVGTGVRSNRFQLTADATWEVDFWGRIRDQHGAAIADAEAAMADLHAARLSLAANTVKSAVTLAAGEAEIQISEENVTRRRLHLGVLEKQLDRGLDPDRAALDVSLSRADLARAEATLALRKRETDAARRSLETLLGSYPAGKEGGLGGLPEVKRAVPAGLPSDLLLRRPDLLAAERRLEGAIRDESAAKKAFLPSFRITGDSGFSTEELSALLEKNAFIWTLAGSVAQSLFQGGRIIAGVEEAKARYNQALEQYASDALTAFQEVETALAAEAYLREQETALQRAVVEAERSVKLAIGQYERGLTEVLTLLDAQQRVFDSRSSLLSVQAQRLRNRADLHLALGGDF